MRIRTNNIFDVGTSVTLALAGGRIPKGSENGANELWIPGGILPNGYSEIVVDPISTGDYIEILTNLK